MKKINLGEYVKIVTAKGETASGIVTYVMNYTDYKAEDPTAVIDYDVSIVSADGPHRWKSYQDGGTIEVIAEPADLAPLLGLGNRDLAILTFAVEGMIGVSDQGYNTAFQNRVRAVKDFLYKEYERRQLSWELWSKISI